MRKIVYIYIYIYMWYLCIFTYTHYELVTYWMGWQKWLGVAGSTTNQFIPRIVWGAKMYYRKLKKLGVSSPVSYIWMMVPWKCWLVSPLYPTKKMSLTDHRNSTLWQWLTLCKLEAMAQSKFREFSHKWHGGSVHNCLFVSIYRRVCRLVN